MRNPFPRDLLNQKPAKTLVVNTVHHSEPADHPCTAAWLAKLSDLPPAVEYKMRVEQSALRLRLGRPRGMALRMALI